MRDINSNDKVGSKQVNSVLTRAFISMHTHVYTFLFVHIHMHECMHATHRDTKKEPEKYKYIKISNMICTF